MEEDDNLLQKELQLEVGVTCLTLKREVNKKYNIYLYIRMYLLLCVAVTQDIKQNKLKQNVIKTKQT